MVEDGVNAERENEKVPQICTHTLRIRCSVVGHLRENAVMCYCDLIGRLWETIQKRENVQREQKVTLTNFRDLTW